MNISAQTLLDLQTTISNCLFHHISIWVLVDTQNLTSPELYILFHSQFPVPILGTESVGGNSIIQVPPQNVFFACNALLHMLCSLICFDQPILCLLPLEYKLHGGRAFCHYFLDASQMMRAHLVHDRCSNHLLNGWMNYMIFNPKKLTVLLGKEIICCRKECFPGRMC